MPVDKIYDIPLMESHHVPGYFPLAGAGDSDTGDSPAVGQLVNKGQAAMKQALYVPCIK